MTWKTKDGQEIPIREMTDDHLRNALRLLERRAGPVAMRIGLEAMAYSCSTTADGASMAAESAADYWMSGEADVEEVFPIYRLLAKEAKRRKLK